MSVTTDVEIQSSDNVLFKMNKKELEMFSGAFPSADSPVESGTPVELPEDSETLGILFKFMRCETHPTLDDVPFDAMLRFAEAAEKYHVYSAIPIYKLNFRQ
ncbi:hypothetical protein BDP27DRAFT_236573 [Rhodocollybia butyracea]|uniref:BTB domain-containing protein n=1 Tax=Rhodocollybia butyracea TaxID=206335 RepID=A0A9P5PIW4_9AGAR|nr:hypothetical protein BDP27DRAFT_236573 [Rhodocollybia butyracea]